MSDTPITKVDAAEAPQGEMGQKYLASGKTLSMRLWVGEKPGTDKEPVARDYETVGYVLSGKAELQIEDQTTVLGPGDSWVVPKGVKHTYKIIDLFSVIEATHPPAEIHDRDKA
jgi:quercetin dioxygenase-like cupin family protein